MFCFHTGDAKFGRTWTALRREGSDGNFTWATTGRLYYDPNQDLTLPGNCAVLKPKKKFKLIDCNHKKTFICEF